MIIDKYLLKTVFLIYLLSPWKVKLKTSPPYQNWSQEIKQNWDMLVLKNTLLTNGTPKPSPSQIYW